MATKVDLHDAQEGLARLLERAGREGERIIVARGGRPLAAVVSVDDLARLELSEAHRPIGGEEREARFRALLAATGLVVQEPTGEPVTFSPIAINGPPLSEEIIADRR